VEDSGDEIGISGQNVEQDGYGQEEEGEDNDSEHSRVGAVLASSEMSQQL